MVTRLDLLVVFKARDAEADVGLDISIYKDAHTGHLAVPHLFLSLIPITRRMRIGKLGGRPLARSPSHIHHQRHIPRNISLYRNP
jgi:hypothetical protein